MILFTAASKVWLEYGNILLNNFPSFVCLLVADWLIVDDDVDDDDNDNDDD